MPIDSTNSTFGAFAFPPALPPAKTDAAEPAAPNSVSADAPKLQKPLNTDVFKTTKNGKVKVNPLRIWFYRLKPEQIEAINESRKLPDNAKIVPDSMGNGYTIRHNIFGITSGTKTLPEGWELKRNILGFTRLVPKDTEGLFIKKD